MDLMLVDVRLAVTDHLPVHHQPVKIHCREPGHHDREQSMCVYAGGIKCFGCGFVLPRRMEALAYLLFHDRTRWRDAIKVAGQYVGTPVDDPRAARMIEEAQASTTPLPACLAELYFDNLYTNRKHRLCWYEHDRGLTLMTVYKYCLGHDGARFTIPVYALDGTLLTIRYRRDDYYAMGEPGPKYCGTTGHNGTVLFPRDVLSPTTGETLAVVEGELDAIRAGQAGIPAVTITNGAGNMNKLPALLRGCCPWVKNLVVIGDMDERGRKAATDAGYEGATLGYRIALLSWDLADGKDLTEYCLNNNEARLKELWKTSITTFPLASMS